MSNYLDIASELRQRRSQEEASRQAQMAQGPQGGGGTIGGSMFQAQQPQQSSPTGSVGSSVLDGLRAYNDSSKGGLNRMLGAGPQGGPFTGAAPAAMSAMGAGGGSSLGAMALGNGAPAAGASGAAMANPAGWLALGAKTLNDTGISSYGDTLKGKWSGNMIDSVLGDNGSAVGQGMGAFGKFVGGDFGGAIKSGKNALSDIFKLKLF